MQKSLSDLNSLQSEINDQLARYKQAILENQELADVKIIYVRIKELQKELNQVSDRIHQKIEEQNSNPSLL